MGEEDRWAKKIYPTSCCSIGSSSERCCAVASWHGKVGKVCHGIGIEKKQEYISTIEAFESGVGGYAYQDQSLGR